MRILLKDGSTFITDINMMPKITIEDGVMSIGTDLIHVDNIVKYTIHDSKDTGVDQSGSNNMFVDWSRVGEGYVTVTNAAKCPIRLYDVTGMNVPIMLSCNGKMITVDFSNQPSGEYIITVGNHSVKCKKQ